MSEGKTNLEIQVNEKVEYKNVTLFKNPIIVLSTTILLTYDQFIKILKFFIRYKPFMLIMIMFLISNFIDGPHKEVYI